MKTQLTKGLPRRLMYIENKDGLIDGAHARIGWVTFSKTGQTIYYRGRALQKAKGGNGSGNCFDVESGESFWISGVKIRGSNVHPAESGITFEIDDDAKDAYRELREKKDS